MKAPAKPTAKAPKAAARAPARSTAKATKAAAKAPAKNVDKALANSATQRVTARATKPAHPQPPMIKTSLQPQRQPSLPAAAAQAAAAAPALRGPREVLTCRDGTEDRHARIAVVLVGGKTESFAYYSKWKPRTCSIYLQRNRDTSRWSDSGSVTSVNAERGVFMIEHGKGEYRFVFRDVDRERYCGMEGAMNGTLTIRRGSDRCDIAGIMEEGVPLGHAVAYAEAAAASGASAEPAGEPARAPSAVAASSGETSLFRRFAQRFQREPSTTSRSSSSPFPSAAGGVSD